MMFLLCFHLPCRAYAAAKASTTRATSASTATAVENPSAAVIIMNSGVSFQLLGFIFYGSFYCLTFPFCISKQTFK